MVEEFIARGTRLGSFAIGDKLITMIREYLNLYYQPQHIFGYSYMSKVVINADPSHFYNF
jgi:hypothetical protein